MTYDPNGQYPPPNQDPNAAGYPTSGPAYPTSGPSYPTSGPGYPTSGGAYPTSGASPTSGPYPPQQQQQGYQQPGYQPSSYDPYQQQGAGYGQQAAAYGQPMAMDPVTGQPLSDKSKITAGLLTLFLGSFGVGRFYLGYTGLGIAQIAATWLTCGLGAIWPLIEGIMILASNNIPDAQGRKLRDN